MLKKFVNIFILIVPLISFLAITSLGQSLKKPEKVEDYLASKKLDINRVIFNVTSIGSRNVVHGPSFGVASTWEQYNYGYSAIVYDYGLWLAGKFNDKPALAISQWDGSYSAGPIINGQAAMLNNPSDSLKYRVYKVTKGDDNSNPDFAEWPSDFGAPVDHLGKPKIYGDQTLWTVYNDNDSTLEYINYWNTHFRDSIKTLPIEVQQLTYARKGNVMDNVNIFSNVVFMEFKIINKGNTSIDSAYIGFWSDIDFLQAGSNPYAVDTSNQLAYCYSGDWGIDSVAVPPAVGFQYLYGPEVPSAGSVAIKDGKKISGYKNLQMSSFHPVNDDTDIDSLSGSVFGVGEGWNAARGFDLKGNVIIDPTTNMPTKFPYSGDPGIGSGWIYPHKWTNGSAGILMFSGPFNFAPNDTQWVMIALVPAKGNDRFESIKIMKEKAAILGSLPYDSLAFGTTPYRINYIDSTNSKYVIPTNYSLSQNYPNPFNPVTTIEYNIPYDGAVVLKLYDVLGREVRTLVDGERPAGNYKVSLDASSLSSGVYFYRLTAGTYTSIKKMVVLK